MKSFYYIGVVVSGIADALTDDGNFIYRAILNHRRCSAIE